MDEVRVGFIGCGGNGRGHLARLLELDAARPVAVCDLEESRAREAAAATGAQPYTDYRALLERDDLDAVGISVPPDAHGRLELDVIARGLPFFVEKPVARHLDVALEIEEAAADAGLITCAGYQLRYCGSADIARDTLSGETVSLAVGRYWSGSARSAAKGWVTELARSGGQLLEQATHTIDMLRYLVGEVAEVSARHANLQLPGMDCPDVHVVTLAFESGALGSLTSTWAYDPLDWSETNVVEVLYADRLLRWGRESVLIRERREGLEDGQLRAAMATEEYSAPGSSIDEVFVDAVRSGDGSAIRSPYGDAVRTLAVCLAALESGQKGKPVRLLA
ncbi:MAG: Gfo/Idh/MocA family oxidoreductase [Gemmatimonadota bacterium]